MVNVARRFYLFLAVLFSISLSGQNSFNESKLIKNLKILSADSMQGRRTGTPANVMAAKFIKDQFKKVDLSPLQSDFEMPFQFQTKSETKTGTNLVGLIKGTSKTDEYIVVSAHYDHLGVRNNKVYNGADDNASGVGALLAIAEYLKSNKPYHHVIIAAFDAEEMGLQGAQAFVKQPPVDLTKIILNINMDMVARADQKELVACGISYNPQLKKFISAVEQTGRVKFVYGHDDPAEYTGKENWTFSSDHGPFHSAKIPFIYFGVADHDDYHQPGDDFEKVDPQTYIDCVTLILKAFIEVDKGLK